MSADSQSNGSVPVCMYHGMAIEMLCNRQSIFCDELPSIGSHLIVILLKHCTEEPCITTVTCDFHTYLNNQTFRLVMSEQYAYIYL